MAYRRIAEPSVFLRMLHPKHKESANLVGISCHDSGNRVLLLIVHVCLLGRLLAVIATIDTVTDSIAELLWDHTIKFNR